MDKTSALTKTKACDKPGEALFMDAMNLARGSRKMAQSIVTHSMLQAYWRIGALVSEEERKPPGQGDALLREHSRTLVKELGRTFSVYGLRMMQRLHELFPDPDKLSPSLSWSHYLLLMNVEKEEARQWYLEKAISLSWTVGQLERHISEDLYERVQKHGPEIIEDSSTDTDATFLGELGPCGWLPEPCILEFLELWEHPLLQAKDLEDALLNALWEYVQNFKSEGRQLFALAGKKMPICIQGEEFMPHMVLYHMNLRCHVLVTLKLDEPAQQEDIAQMEKYIALYDSAHRLQDENPAFGIVLACMKGRSSARYSVSKGFQHTFAERYGKELPTTRELQQLLETIRGWWETYGGTKY